VKCRPCSWIADRFRDLFYAVGNQHLDLARCIAGLFSGLAAFAILWNALVMHKEIDLGGFLGGLAALAASIWAGVAAKDWARAKIMAAMRRPMRDEGDAL
jgi:hypothetical protein